MRVGLILQNPSPHQLALLNALASTPNEYFVGYVNESNQSRTWGTPKPDLEWAYISHYGIDTWLNTFDADIYVLSSVYTDLRTHRFVRRFVASSSHYVYMGEPPRPAGPVKAKLQEGLLAHVLRHTSGIVATGDAALKRYLALRDLPGISVPYYPDELPDQSKRRRGNDKVRFITSSQLITRKGLDVLIAACKELPRHGWSLDIYGDGPERKKLERKAQKSGRPIHFHGAVPYEHRYRMFDHADVFIMPTRWDGWGMAVAEALIAGLPIISTDQAMSACEFVKNFENGFLGPAESPEFLTASMQRFIGEEVDYEAFSRAATTAVSNYTAESGAINLDEFLTEVLST